MHRPRNPIGRDAPATRRQRPYRRARLPPDASHEPRPHTRRQRRFPTNEYTPRFPIGLRCEKTAPCEASREAAIPRAPTPTPPPPCTRWVPGRVLTEFFCLGESEVCGEVAHGSGGGGANDSSAVGRAFVRADRNIASWQLSWLYLPRGKNRILLRKSQGPTDCSRARAGSAARRWRRRRGSRARRTVPWCRSSRSRSMNFSGPSSCWLGRRRTGASGMRGFVRGRSGRASGGVAVGALARLPVGRGDVSLRRSGRAPGHVAVGARDADTCFNAATGGHLELLPWGRERGDTCTGRYGRALGGAEVGAGALPPVGRL